MSATKSQKVRLVAGKVYRTSELKRWDSNPTRLAHKLVEEGHLTQLRHGLYVHSSQSRFGPVPPKDRELLRAFLAGDRFVETGPRFWNALGLGTTAVFAMPLVYNQKRSGVFEFGKRRFLLKRVAFPSKPTPEWYVVDLFENAEQAATSRSSLANALAHALARGEFDAKNLRQMARRYGSKQTQALVAHSLQQAAR